MAEYRHVIVVTLIFYLFNLVCFKTVSSSARNVIVDRGIQDTVGYFVPVLSCGSIGAFYHDENNCKCEHPKAFYHSVSGVAMCYKGGEAAGKDKNRGPVRIIKQVKIANSFLQSVSNQFHVIILSLPI